jgi:hypothetical protein
MQKYILPIVFTLILTPLALAALRSFEWTSSQSQAVVHEFAPFGEGDSITGYLKAQNRVILTVENNAEFPLLVYLDYEGYCWFLCDGGLNTEVGLSYRDGFFRVRPHDSETRTFAVSAVSSGSTDFVEPWLCDDTVTCVVQPYLYYEGRIQGEGRTVDSFSGSADSVHASRDFLYRVTVRVRHEGSVHIESN